MLSQWTLRHRNTGPIIDADMILLDETARTPIDDAASTGSRAAHRGMAAASVPASLVLFVGVGFQPSAVMCDLLARDGMRCLWLAGPGPALRAAQLARFDAVVIDAAALGSRSAALLAELNAALRCPMIVVANQADEVDEIVALELGADAYLARPLAPRRLRAHLGALLRVRVQPEAREPAVDDALDPPTRVAGWQLDRVGNRLLRSGVRVDLTDVQCALLQCLFEAQGCIVPRARLAAALPNRRDVSMRSVDVYIHRLRQRLRDEGVDGVVIESIRGRGYLLASPP